MLPLRQVVNDEYRNLGSDVEDEAEAVIPEPQTNLERYDQLMCLGNEGQHQLHGYFKYQAANDIEDDSEENP